MGGIGGDAASPIFKFAFFKLLHFPRLWVQHPPHAPHPPPTPPDPLGPSAASRAAVYSSSTHHNAGLCPVSALFRNRMPPIRRSFLERSQ